MKRITTTILAFTFFCSTFAFAQEIAPRTRVETMFNSLKPGEAERAIEVFAKNSLIKGELVNSLQSQAKTLITPSNPILGFEFIQEENVGQSVKRLTYILKTTDQPLVWNFSFYKPGAVWVPLRVTFVGEF